MDAIATRRAMTSELAYARIRLWVTGRPADGEPASSSALDEAVSRIGSVDIFPLCRYDS
jgi:hypothetical protein